MVLLYYNQNFDLRIQMSLIRNSSRKQFSTNSDDLASCLDQKNSMIAVLQAEVEELRLNQQKYDRMQQELYRAKQRYENCIRDYQIGKLGNLERLDLTAKNCLQLKIQLDHLRKEAELKGQQLKEAKAESQHLVQHSNRRQDETEQAHIRGEELRAANQLLKIQQERTRSQLILAREQLERQRKQNANINKSLQNVKDKCFKTQSYIRSLLREESTLNQSLAKIEDQNNYLDTHISELNGVHAMAAGEVSNTEKQMQENRFSIASKQLQLKRGQKQNKQTAKSCAAEKDKLKVMNEQAEQKRSSLGRMQNEIRQCSQELNYILAKNNQVTDVNNQLRNDLNVCERHLQNVARVNKNMQVQLNKFKEVNLTAIKKLQQPMNGIPYRQHKQPQKLHATTSKWNNTSRMTATGGFQFSSSY